MLPGHTSYFIDISSSYARRRRNSEMRRPWVNTFWWVLLNINITVLLPRKLHRETWISSDPLHLDQVFQQSHIWWLWLCSKYPAVQEIQTPKQRLLACAICGSWTALEYLPGWCSIHCEWPLLSWEQMTHSHINESPVLDRGGQTHAHTSPRLSSWLHSAEVSGLLSVL